MRSFLSVVLFLVAACPPAVGPPDPEPLDAGFLPDAGIVLLDGGPDAGLMADAGPLGDAGIGDAGSVEDAGQRPDSGLDGGPDGSIVDAGSVDAGVPDAGSPWPAVDAYLPLRGPGGPVSSFDAGFLGTTCAFLPGGPGDVDHHNIVHAFDGYLALPWAPESGGGGLSLFDFSQPCSPRKVAEVVEPRMRETHAMAFAQLGGTWFAATNSRTSATSGGVLLWDLSNPLQPTVAAAIDVPGFTYPDGYARVVQSMAWQGRWLYLASGDLGVDIVDTADPRRPVRVRRHTFAPTMRTFSIKAVGTLLFVHASESPRVELLDISDPTQPQPIPGGSFLVRDGPSGVAREAYGANLQGGYAWFARKDSGGGVIIYDVRQPTQPRFAGISQTGFGNGGYVFVKDDTLAFVGESGGASLYDVSNLTAIRRLRTFTLRGDLDTITPVGNLAVLSVDADGTAGQSTSVVPYQEAPDRTPPHVSWAWPGASSVVPVTARLGVTFSEFVEPRSVFDGSVRLFETVSGAKVDGVLASQESVVTFSPSVPLRPATRYTLWIPAGGVADWNGNAVAREFQLAFETEP